MNSILDRAEALKAIVAAESAVTQPLAEAVIDCCMDLVNAGEASVASSILDNVLCSSGPASSDLSLRMQVCRARVLRAKGEYNEALALTLDILSTSRELLNTRSVEYLELRINEAACLVQINRAGEAFDRLMAVRAHLLTSADTPLSAECAIQLATAEWLRGDHRSAKRFALEAVVSARRCKHQLFEARGLDHVSRLERAGCRWASAEEANREALALFERSGFTLFSAISHRQRGIIEWKRGRLVSALEATDKSLEKAAIIGNRLHEWYASLLKSVILIHSGKFADATAILGSRQGWDQPRHDSRPSLLTVEYLGDAYLEQGDFSTALDKYLSVWPIALAVAPKGDIVAELRRRMAECRCMLGDAARAYGEAKMTLEHCRELCDRYEEAATYRVLAMSAARLGLDSEARAWFDQGFAFYDDIETPYEWGKLWMAYGDWLSESGDLTGAAEAFGAACEHFAGMGAEAKLLEARRSLDAVKSTRDGDEAICLDGVLGRTLRPRRRPSAARELERLLPWSRDVFGVVTRDRFLIRLLQDVAKLARSQTPILVLGESGTGKELIAQGIHRLSGQTGMFNPINCGALPREIVESELFGHVAGAFTGATRDKQGLLEVSSGGTVFLDEIAEMAHELQTRLLRFLETGEVRRVGATRSVAVRTRVVAATNRERAALERGEGFRTDLYYRLAHAVIELPPLRRRPEDIELLVDHFLDEACREESKEVTISRAARSRLQAYSWPGNVRQLKAMVRRLVLLAAPGHEVGEGELQLHEGGVATTLVEELEQAERRKIADAMREARGSRTEAARTLGMPRTTLINKLKRYGLG